jgi:hypothetical protein
MEQWKDIKGFEGMYQVSNLGNVKSLKRTAKHWQGGIRIVPERILKLIYKREYAYVDLSINCKRKCVQVHRLVAEAFVENNNNEYYLVMHMDNNPSNNNYENLRWGNHSTNANHCVESGRWNNQHTI